MFTIVLLFVVVPILTIVFSSGIPVSSSLIASTSTHRNVVSRISTDLAYDADSSLTSVLVLLALPSIGNIDVPDDITSIFIT